MRRVACLRAGVVASIIIAAGAQAAAAMPADRATVSTVASQSAASSTFSLFAEKSQTSDAHGAVSLRVFGFERIAANGFDAPPPSYFGSVPSSLALDRILDLPSASTDGNDSQPDSDSLVTDAVFGIAMTPSSGTDLDPAPIAFAALSSTTASTVPGATPVNLRSSASVGLKFKLLGGEHVVTVDALTTQNAIAAADLNSSPFFFGSPGIRAGDGRHRTRPDFPTPFARRTQLRIVARDRERRRVHDAGISHRRSVQQRARRSGPTHPRRRARPCN